MQPPSLWIDDSTDSLKKEDIGEKIASFASSLISGSVSEAAVVEGLPADEFLTESYCSSG